LDRDRSPAAVEPRTHVEAESRSIIVWIPVVIGRRRPVVIRRRIPGDVGAVALIGRWRLAHVEINPLWNSVLGRERMTSPEQTGLDELIRPGWKGAHHIIKGVKIMERPIRIAEDFDMHRGR